jgi:hypothetical protein
MEWWRDLNAELAKRGEREATFGEFRNAYDAVTSASEAAMRIRAQRIRDSHAEEGFDI